MGAVEECALASAPDAISPGDWRATPSISSDAVADHRCRWPDGASRASAACGRHSAEHPGLLRCRVGVVTQTHERSDDPQRARVGTVSFSVSDGRSERSLDRDGGEHARVSAAADPARLRPAALERGAVPEIDDFLAVEDDWLAGYFRMLISELEAVRGRHAAGRLAAPRGDRALASSAISRGGTRTPASTTAGRWTFRSRVNPLRPVVMRRVEEYVTVNLASDIPLEGARRRRLHVGRPFPALFRAAAGTTPHRFVLDKRLQKAKQMLKSSDAPIAAVATECGFRNPSHFSVQFHGALRCKPFGLPEIRVAAFAALAAARHFRSSLRSFRYRLFRLKAAGAVLPCLSSTQESNLIRSPAAPKEHAPGTNENAVATTCALVMSCRAPRALSLRFAACGRVLPEPGPRGTARYRCAQ